MDLGPVQPPPPPPHVRPSVRHAVERGPGPECRGELVQGRVVAGASLGVLVVPAEHKEGERRSLSVPLSKA